MAVLPGGTVTFLFTDIEGSTRLWEQYPEAMRAALARHDALVRQAIEQQEGHVFKTVGDAFCAAFAIAPQAFAAALAAQSALQAEPWLDGLVLRVRMALHTGAAELRENDYFGQPLNRVARLLAAGHGGQVLLSLPTEELVRDTLPPLVSLQHLGEHRLRDLDRPETVFQLLHPGLTAAFPPLRSLSNPDMPNNLPLQLTSFIGREKELAEVKNLLARTHLLTLTGSGGAGKTRLSLQAAAEVLEDYPNGVWLIELASLTDPTLVPQAVATALGLSEQTGIAFTQMLTEHLKSKKLLLVLDNCEHLLSACAHLVDTLIRACPQVRVLASSREGLGIAGEQTYRIPSLSLPDRNRPATVESIGQYEAVRLFVERALAALPGFVVTNEKAPALASVCHRLDGIPLAIELAAARVRSLSMEEINTRLDNRFRLLTGGSKTALPRQQTLAAAIGWSYDLLQAQEKSLLARLSVFLGGWTLEAAEAVGAGGAVADWEVVDLLGSLVDKSLVMAETGEEHARYRLMETVRQYALDRLMQSEESQGVRERHRDYFLKLAEETRPKLHGPEQGKWLTALETEHDNLRQALQFCLEEPDTEQGGRAGLRLGAALQQFWWTRGHRSEGRERLNALLAHTDGQEPDLATADALNGVGVLTWMLGDYTGGRALHERSLAIRRTLGSQDGIAISLSNLGNVARSLGDYALARSLALQSLEIARAVGNRVRIGNALGNLGGFALLQGDYPAARAFLEESLAMWRELGNRAGIEAILISIGGIAMRQGDYASARSLYEESLTMSRELGDRQSIAQALSSLGSIASKQGDYPSARALHEESLALVRELGDQSGTANALNDLGLLANDQGDPALARSLFEESLAASQTIANSACLATVLLNLGMLADQQKDASAARSRYEESLLIRRRMGDRHGIAQCLCSLGGLSSRQGDYAAARALLTESLMIRQELREPLEITFSLEEFAVLADKEGEEQRAMRLWGAYDALQKILGYRLSPNEQKRLEDDINVARKALGEETFAVVWAEGQRMTADEAITYALDASPGRSLGDR